MAGGAISAGAGGRAQEYTGRLTPYVFVCAIIGAAAGLIFGYDNGIAGGVVDMPDFYQQFFPQLGDLHQSSDPYCKYNDHMVQLFVSSLFLAGAVGAIIGSRTTTTMGRRMTMLIGGISFLGGSILQAAAVNTAMLIVGRMLLGIGVGLATQSAPLFLSEMAPYNARGALNICFQLAITIGILVAQLINYGTSNISPHGWRISLGLAAVPALILVVGASCLPETPNSLIERGHNEEGRRVLERIRGVSDVDAEFNDICEAAAASRAAGNQWATIIRPAYRPQLALAILIPALQQLTGINSVIFYAPQLFRSMGSGQSVALLNTVIIGAVNVLTTLVAIWGVDRQGRRFWFLEGGLQMIASEIVIGSVLGAQFTPEGTLPAASTGVVLAFICVFIAGFAWSWGPLCWLVCSEIQPLETRSSGYAISVAANFLLTFLIGQCFLSMLCAMQFGIFFFFAGWVAVMTIFALLFIPETKGVPIEEIEERLFMHHWFWGRAIAGHTKQERRWSDPEKRGASGGGDGVATITLPAPRDNKAISNAV